MATKTKKTNKVTANAQVTENKTDLNQVISKLSTLTKTATSSGSSIYKDELFDGQDPKGKKATRRRIRRIRDKFLGAYLESKSDKSTLKQIQEDWKEFSSQVYKDSTLIFEKNTSEEDQKVCRDFIKSMAIDYSK